MTTPTAGDWRDLFTPGAQATALATVELNVVRRNGEPFLFLPAEPRLAAGALALYPAQTAKARAAKFLFNMALRFGLKPRLERVSIPLDNNDPFVRFLIETSRLPEQIAPRFAVLAGNAHAAGRRFVLLLFATGGEPAAVVKAGASAPARRLLTHEENFLRTASSQTRGLPKLRGTLYSTRAQAFATDFFAGHSPRLDDTRPLAELLTSWVNVGELVTMKELAAWQRLVVTAAERPLPSPVQALAEARLHATLAHGDCAPWNIKVTRGEWTLLDWERGEPAGVPGWDWFHFVIQPAVLVRRESVLRLFERFERLLTGEGFLCYATHAGINGHERALALAYLCHCTRVTRQSEGWETVAALERAAAARWFPGKV